MVGAPGIAVADPDADGAVSAGVDDSSSVTEPVATASAGTPETAPNEPSAADSAADSAAAAERNAVEGVSSTVGSGRQPGDPAITGTGSSTTETPAVTTNSSTTESGAVAPDAVSTSTDSEPVSSDSDAIADPSTADSPASTGTAGTEVVPATKNDAPVTTDVPPAEVAQVHTDVAPVAATQVPYLALLGSSVMAAISDVVEAVKCLVTDVVVGTLTQLQSGLAMLFALAGVEPAVASLARIGVELPAPVRAALAVKFSAAAPRALPPNKTLLPVNTTSTMTTTLHALAAVGPTQFAAAGPSAPGGPAPTGPRSFLDAVGQKLLAIPSLMGLAVAALPGLSGLVVLTTAGVRLGYRQAKANFAAQVQGVARFARVEPSEVGRGGSLVFLRPRAARAQSLTAASTLDKVA